MSSNAALTCFRWPSPHQYHRQMVLQLQTELCLSGKLPSRALIVRRFFFVLGWNLILLVNFTRFSFHSLEPNVTNSISGVLCKSESTYISSDGLCVFQATFSTLLPVQHYGILAWITCTEQDMVLGLFWMFTRVLVASVIKHSPMSPWRRAWLSLMVGDLHIEDVHGSSNLFESSLSLFIF